MSVQGISFKNLSTKETEFQYILCVGSSGTLDIIKSLGVPFQYILCVGSSFKKVFLFFFIEVSFNTSYVSVQELDDGTLEEGKEGFNTSYVSVQVGRLAPIV